MIARRLSRRLLALGVSAAVAACAGLVVAAGQLQPALPRPNGPPAVAPADGFGGLEWTFVRIKYHAWTTEGQRNLGYWDEPWAIDAPAAEQNLTRRVKTATSIHVHDPIVLTLDDPQLWTYPWIYMVEPGNLRLQENEVPILREFLLRGGTLTFDDFHGPFEWQNLEKELKRVFPERTIVEITPPHPIFSSFYKIDKYPQIPGLGSFFNGRTWEKGGYVSHLRGIQDDHGRFMVLINWNTDMGDGFEWSNAEEYPGYLKFTAQAYRMMLNELIYALTR